MAMQTKVGLYPVTGFPGQEVNPGSGNLHRRELHL